MSSSLFMLLLIVFALPSLIITCRTVLKKNPRKLSDENVPDEVI